MQVIHTAAAVRAAIPPAKTVALVPTMGGLHDGHLALVKHARTLADTVIVSIYVNPLQFAPHEDFATYPRRLQDDCTKLQEWADIVYAPADDEMYPQPQTIGISLPPLAEQFCGASRRGFFHGVAVVVCKLFNQCRPQLAVFGRKDYQQAILMRQMSEQLGMTVDIVMHPTVRAADGLALSSRNEYLTAEQSACAPLLYRTLQQTAQQLQGGARDYDALCDTAMQQLAAAGFTNDYFAIRTSDDLGEPRPDADQTLLAGVWLDKVRLIDNLTVTKDGNII